MADAVWSGPNLFSQCSRTLDDAPNGTKRFKFEDVYICNLRTGLYGPVFDDGKWDRCTYKPVSRLTDSMLLTLEPTWIVRNSKAIRY